MNDETLIEDVDSQDSEMERLVDEKKEWWIGRITWVHNGRLLYELAKVNITLVRTVHNNKAKCTLFLTYLGVSHGWQSPMGGGWPQVIVVLDQATPGGSNEILRVDFGEVSLGCGETPKYFYAPVPQELFEVISAGRVPSMRAGFRKCP